MTICLAFLVANAEKFPHGGWVSIAVSGLLFGLMFVWFRARKIKNRYREFEPIYPHLQRFTNLSADETVPKYCTHLVYLTSANLTSQVETKIIYSIFNKRPKRADVYWFLHVHYFWTTPAHKNTIRNFSTRKGHSSRIPIGI